MSAQFYYRYIRISKMFFKKYSALFLEESLSDDGGGPKRLRNDHFDDVRLQTSSTEEQPILIRAAKPFLKN